MAQKEKANMEPILKVVELKPKQSFLNLDTGVEDEKEILSKRYEVRAYNAETDGTPEEFEKAALKEVAGLVSPNSEKINAFVSYATSKSYQDGKVAAMATGNYLTPDLKPRIVATMRQNPKWADTKASECFDAWKKAYIAKTPGAVKLLETIQAAAEFDF